MSITFKGVTIDAVGPLNDLTARKHMASDFEKPVIAKTYAKGKDDKVKHTS